MKPVFIFIIILLFHSAAFAFTAGDSSNQINQNNISYHQKKGINIYVISKDKYFDFTNRIILWQAKAASFFHGKKLKIILAKSTNDAEKKIEGLVDKHHYIINNLWFDSHGKYRKGYASFMIGTDEYNYKNISDSDHIYFLKKIANFCTPNTKIGIGSCYAGADYEFPVLKNGMYVNMYGDSLLKGMANIFKGSSIFGSESWVMAKPWIFGSKNAMAGYPLDREYRDVIFKPVWEHMGVWHRYSTTSSQMETINTVHLSKTGEILIDKNSYLTQKKAQRKLSRNLMKLKPDLYRLNS